jgi:hypothetical protein
VPGSLRAYVQRYLRSLQSSSEATSDEGGAR